jgi:hypothetical protein
MLDKIITYKLSNTGMDMEVMSHYIWVYAKVTRSLAQMHNQVLRYCYSQQSVVRIFKSRNMMSRMFGMCGTNENLGVGNRR